VRIDRVCYRSLIPDNTHMPRKNRTIHTAITGFFLALGFLGIQTGAAPISYAEASRAVVKIMPLGDSITVGCCDEALNYGGYRHLLYDLLSRDGVKFDFVGSEKRGDVPDADNEGHGGWTIRKIQDGIDNQGWLETYTLDIILLHIGTNDMYEAGTARDAPAALAALLDDIATRFPNVRIIVAQILPMANPLWEANVEQYNSAVPAIVTSRGRRVSMVNMHETFSTADLSGGVHPSTAGYDKMARIWETAVLAVLHRSGHTMGETTGDTTGSHPLVRGRAYVANGTLVADDGSILRAVLTHTAADNYASRNYGDLNWWRALRDVGHFNAVRAAAYLGTWFGHGNAMDVPTMKSVLDTIVANAQQTGMYVIIDEHSSEGFNSPTDWKQNVLFWSAIAPRYKDQTNVIYELKNEPDVGRNWRALPGYENSAFALIRSLAPESPIIAWSLESITAVDDQYGLLNLLAQGNQINYSNAVVGYHPYEAIGQEERLANLASQMRRAGYPIVMTEYSNDHTPPLSYLYSLEAAGTSWFLLDGDGFTDGATGVSYGNPSKSPIPLHITWPKD
jgi:acyl-CoA thioesterase-1